VPKFSLFYNHRWTDWVGILQPRVIIKVNRCQPKAGYQMTDIFSGLPFADLKSLISKLNIYNILESNIAIEHQQKLIMSASDQGRLGQLIPWLAGWQGRTPSIKRPELCLFAGASDVGDGASRAAAEAAAKLQIVLLSSGGSAANHLALQGSVGMRVFDLAIDQPGHLMSAGAAMSELGCARAFAFGMEAVAANADLLILAGFGPGSQAAAAATALGFFGGTAADWSEDWLPLIQAAAELHGSHRQEPLELLRCCGSREMAAICGAIIAARTQFIPVIIDGFVATVAAAVLAAVHPGAIDHVLLSGSDGTAAHDRLIEKLELHPLLGLKIRATDGLGGLLAAQLVRAAADIHASLPTTTQMSDLSSEMIRAS
jgi:nicotinate-nucleotide--dimethylbenzimidazole phosphoribosyltransferase